MRSTVAVPQFVDYATAYLLAALLGWAAVGAGCSTLCTGSARAALLLRFWMMTYMHMCMQRMDFML